MSGTTSIEIYDTTLRDGTQAEDIHLSVEDKVRIALKLDELGIDFIEGGWPGSNPKDVQFFSEIQSYALRHSRIAAFGSTHSAKTAADDDPNLQALVNAKAPVVTIFGKTWDVHVRDALRVSLEKNLAMIEDSLAWLRPRVETLFYDAEHFFDGFKANPDYALETLRRAAAGGAERLVLCDTNGGTLPHEVTEIVERVRDALGPEASLGIHAHNDADVAVANTLAAVRAGAVHVQGTMNGFGERCGNANLCSIIPALVLKMGLGCTAGERLERLTATSRFISEIANLPHNKYQPYVGASAFAHKGGIHVSAVQRNPETYEHVPPERVGNVQRILISELAGRSNVLAKARQFGLDIDSQDPAVLEIVAQLKELEARGFQFEGAEASFELLMRQAMGTRRKYFDLMGFRVIDHKVREDEAPQAEATVMVRVGGQVEHTAAVGDGPVNALDNAIRKALDTFYPQLREVSLLDYKVRVLPGRPGTGAKVRVLIESTDGRDKWGTVGVSHDILEASWQALVDGIRYKLLKSEHKDG
ncbi:citramalate synthase [Dissulfurirhabdus thermomarina]|uniref:Citramalate synthase n=1 Tax=Dissulfurirhabdus thermomarina TaxID=1765737 RepID=A0A6N9TSS4_DISTH|nr:citramalate synthase [Dissulfurirhabdus thermomarina]NDY41586.1 citramalate synthase [Dissulfurirhabdus thermomarina]NMX22359.1 citramalate synthase [Dissulfurirhabdus thermomarina]